MIVPIHNHSYFSALDGLASPLEIAERCQEIGAEACGLTDHGVVSGHLEFAKTFQQHNLKPLFGCELYHGLKTTFKGKERDQAHFIAIAQTDEGLRNLWRLVNSTATQDHFRYVGRVFWEDIEKYNEGLIATSACALGLVPQGIIRGDFEPLNHYLDIFGDRFYLEIHTYPCDHPFKDRDFEGDLNMRTINEALVDVATERGIPMVYANDAHYANPDQAIYHDLYVAVQTRQSIYTPPDERKMWHPPEALSILDEEHVRESLSYLPEAVVDEALANSVEIANKVNANLPEVKRHLPIFVPGDCPWTTDEQKGETPEALFVELVGKGIQERYGTDADDTVWDRVFYETETLLRDNIHHYFLMGWDTIQAAKNMDVAVGPGRGSSAGSIVAYALGITDVDPLHYGLIFERFWNSGRTKGFPDIDTDFSRAGRPKIIEYLKDRWERDKVCAIGTVAYFKPKSVIDHLAKWCDISYTEADELKDIVGQTTKIEILGHLQIGWDPELEPGKKYYVDQDVGTEIVKWIRADPVNKDKRATFVALCKAFNSRVKQYGIHASGIVISDVPLADELPAYLRGSDDDDAKVPATQFPMDDVDDRQFVKLDVLGLRTLDVIEYWDKFMAEEGIKIQWSGLDKQEHPKEMWDLLGNGFTAGIFQIEDGYAKQLCKLLNPQSVSDLSIIGALNRPGPRQAHGDAYIERRQTGKVTYAHPNLEKLVGESWGETLGLPIYQEHIILLFNQLGYSLSESDAVRKILGKKRPEQLNALRDGTGEWEGRGYFDMARRAGIEAIAEPLWNELEGFADYSFNKSHAVAYAILGLRQTFAKYYAAPQFYAASTCSFTSRDRKKRTQMLPEYINECFKQDIAVRPPDIRYARPQSYAKDGNWYFGFSDIKGVGISGEYIAMLRDEAVVNTSTPETFTASLEQLNDEFLAEKKLRVKEGTWSKKERSPKQLLGAGKVAALIQAGAWDDTGCREITLTERQQNEEELLGVILTDNTKEVLERNAEVMAHTDSYEVTLTPWYDKLDETEEREFFQYDVAGVVTKKVEKRTRQGNKPFGIATIELGENQLEFMVPSKKWSSFKRLFKQPRCVGIFTVRHNPPNEYGENYMYHSGRLLK